MSCKHHSHARLSLLAASRLSVLETIAESRFEILPRDAFFRFLVSSEQIYYAVAKKPDKRFSARMKEKTFAFVGNDWNTLRVESFCVFIVQTF